jgi:hypothetical protein
MLSERGTALAGPGSLARQTMSDEKAIKVNVYVTPRCVRKRIGLCRVCK